MTTITPHMKLKLHASLAALLQTWLETADNDEPNHAYMGNETAEHVADAALAVYCGLAEAQDYAIAQGMLAEAEE